MKIGDRVRHWFAGIGTVTKLDRTTVWVRWDKCGTVGGAWLADLSRCPDHVGDSPSVD